MQPFLKEAILASILNDIDYEHYSIDLLAERVGRYCGLSIVLIPHTMFGLTEFGFWLKGPKHDYIFYVSNTARVHQEHIIMHELGHILLGHETYRVTADSTADDALCRARTIQRDCREEEEAEEFAITLQSEIVRRMGLRALIEDRGTTRDWSDLLNNLS